MYEYFSTAKKVSVECPNPNLRFYTLCAGRYELGYWDGKL